MEMKFTENTKTREIKRDLIKTYNFQTNNIDNKGRKIGLRATIHKSEFENITGPGDDVFAIPAGEYFETHAQKTKNGERFGGYPESRYFTTIEEAQNYIHGRFSKLEKSN